MAAGEQSENTGLQLTSDPMGVVDRLLHHRKERMFFMIINLLRLRPGIFMEQVSAFKARCDLRQTSVRGLLVFAPADVDAAIEMLSNTQQTHALELNADLCELCREPKIVGVSPANSAGKTFTVENNKASRFDVTKGATNGDKAQMAQAIRKKKLSRRMQSNGFKALKDLTVDFACREDLAITSLREFLEVFVQSVKRDQVFHQELLSSMYMEMGLAVDFNHYTSTATLRIMLAQATAKNRRSQLAN